MNEVFFFLNCFKIVIEDEVGKILSILNLSIDSINLKNVFASFGESKEYSLNMKLSGARRFTLE